jgi:2,4-dienoyl-CoA reductase-like NADH-dependent reductase (Old Yellow Enzyme family)/pyruvate/2-oxoglutarate dehydrogenase complex dihydrolipoamide dehydrogenase (E3) component
MPSLHDPIKIGTLELPNRMFLAPTVKNHADEDGYINDRVIRGFVEEARGGWGLLQCSASYIHPEGNIFRRMIGIYNDKTINGLERLAYAIHREGMLCSIQLIHGGALCNSAITGLPVVGPSTKGGVFGEVRGLESDEVEERAQFYADAAARAKEAGFDAVNIHGCQGTLNQQFMSPYTNDREDKWGQDPGLFPETVAKKVRAAVGPDYPVIWRLAAHEFMGEWLKEPGYTEEYGKEMAKRLEPLVDCFDVTGGRIGFTSMFAFPAVYAERATRVHLATEIKSVVQVPVMGVAKIMDDRIAKEVVESGRADIAHVCRPAIADAHMARKIFEGRPEDIRKCISCNWCLETLFRQRVVLCAVNAAYSREGEYELVPTTNPKKVMVVGGGVAGMEAAITLAERGHTVDLYEKDEELGGLVQFVASAHPRLNTRDLRNAVDYHVTQVEKRERLTLHLETEVTRELVEKEKPDAIVVAVGSEELVPEIPGATSDKVVTNEDYLRAEGNVDVGQKVVVIGGNYGAETALSLANEGKEVVMVEESDTINRPIYIQDLYSRSFQLDRMVEEANIVVMLDTKVVEISDAGVTVENADGKTIVECDSVIMAYNRKPKTALYESLKGLASKVYAAGDCVAPRDIFHSIDDGAYYARKI